MTLSKRTGEPYNLAGKRMAFTSWYYVRPSGLGWFNDKGEDVTVIGYEEPGFAHIKHYEPAVGVSLIVKCANRSGQLIMPTRTYEEGGIAFNTIITENGTYRGWGNTGWGDLKNRGIKSFCYFESEDGRCWKKPDCGIYDFEGNKNNNILCNDGGSVFIDPLCPSNERYKWISEHQFTKETYERYLQQNKVVDSRSARLDVGVYFGAQGAISPDGLNWTLIDNPLLMMHTDTQIVSYYDIQLNKYVGYFRDWMVGVQAEPYSKEDNKEFFAKWLRAGRRVIARAETDDFRNWPLPDIVLEPSLSMGPNEVLYTNCKTTIPYAPDNHLMFPAVWNTFSDQMYLVLATSHNGRFWNYVSNHRVLEAGALGQWDGGCIFAVPNMIELKNGDFALPYTGYNVPHKYPRKKAVRGVGYALWPKGRLMGIKAEQKGSFTTVAVVSPGVKLFINAETEKDGYIEIEAADFQGYPIKGRDFSNSVRLSGDCFKTPIVWKMHNDLGISRGEPIMLRFKLERATIYYLDFEEE